MGGIIRAFVTFTVAGLGWTMGKNAGEKLWTRVQEKFPVTIEQAKKAVDDLLEPLRKAKPGSPSAASAEGDAPASDADDRPSADGE